MTERKVKLDHANKSILLRALGDVYYGQRANGGSTEWVWTISANTADYFAGYNQFQNLTVGGKTRSGVLYRVCWFV